MSLQSWTKLSINASMTNIFWNLGLIQCLLPNERRKPWSTFILQSTFWETFVISSASQMLIFISNRIWGLQRVIPQSASSFWPGVLWTYFHAYFSYDYAGSSSKELTFCRYRIKKETSLTFSKFEGDRKLLVETNSLD